MKETVTIRRQVANMDEAIEFFVEEYKKYMKYVMTHKGHFSKTESWHFGNDECWAEVVKTREED